MIWPLLFTLTSSHTPAFTHSVPATLYLLFLEYIELILAQDFFCYSFLLAYSSPRLWHGSAFTSSRSLLSYHSLREAVSFCFICLQSTYLYLALNHLLVHSRMCVRACVFSFLGFLSFFGYKLYESWNLFIAITPELVASYQREGCR